MAAKSCGGEAALGSDLFQTVSSSMMLTLLPIGTTRLPAKPQKPNKPTTGAIGAGSGVRTRPFDSALVRGCSIHREPFVCVTGVQIDFSQVKVI